MEYQKPHEPHVNPSLNEKGLYLISLPFEEFCKKSFEEINDTLKTSFPEDSNGESHRILFDALQGVVIEEGVMKPPVDLILKSDGLMIRVCSWHTGLFNEYNKLAKKLHLEDRITHGVCNDCYLIEMKRLEQPAKKISQHTRESVFGLSLPIGDVPAIDTTKLED